MKHFIVRSYFSGEIKLIDEPTVFFFINSANDGFLIICAIGLPISISFNDKIFTAALLNHSVSKFLFTTTIASGIDSLNSSNLFSNANNFSCTI